jgi:non-heme chloroperoxidase
MHGWPLSGDTFDETALALADNGFRAVVPDRRGFGRSDQPWDGYDYDTFADDVAAVLENAGVGGPIALVGFSMGGGEVARFPSRYRGTEVSHAVLIGSVLPFMRKTDDNPDGVPPEVLGEGVDALRADKAEFFRGFLDDFFGKGWASPVSDAAIRNAWRQAMTAGLRPILACANAFFETDFRPDLQAFTIPTLIIHGTEDRTVPVALARAAAKAIEGAKLVEYEDGAHGLFASHTQRLIDDLLGFLGANG